jgi:hypothetical protein
MNGFRYQKWDPVLIISQIIAVQSLYYLGIGFWILLATFAIDRAPSLDYIFSYEVFNASSWKEKSLIILFFFNAITR